MPPPERLRHSRTSCCAVLFRTLERPPRRLMSSVVSPRRKVIQPHNREPGLLIGAVAHEWQLGGPALCPPRTPPDRRGFFLHRREGALQSWDDRVFASHLATASRHSSAGHLPQLAIGTAGPIPRQANPTMSASF